MSMFLNPDLYQILRGIYSQERMMENIETLYALEKPRGYSAYRTSTAWCAEVLEKAGLSDVCRIAHKADGETASYDFIMPQAWDLCGRCTLELVEPGNETIADTEISTIYVSEYSAPTPEGGVTAELVDYSDLDPESPDCKGKLVFYRGYLPAQHPLYHSLAAAGCAGIVFAAFNTIEHEPDKPSWTNGHGHIGWYHLKEDPVVPVFCVTPKKGIELIELLSKGRVVLRGEMKTKLYDGEIYTVTATIPGKSEDEFAILGHLYEPFRSDDCQGFAIGVEVAVMLKKLIDDGTLPQPEKTLRLVFSMERYGFAAFFASHNKRILAAVSVDTMTCEAAEVLKSGFLIKESPISCPFFGDMLFAEAMGAFCPELPWKMSPGNMSDDCWAAEKTVDIPTNWVVSGCGYNRGDYHHCDAPIFDGIRPELLEKIVPVLGVYTAVLICGDREHFRKLAIELERTAAYWLELRKNIIAGKAATGKISKQDARWGNKAAELLYLGRMDSFNRFYPDLVTPEIPKHWADGFCRSLPERALTAAEKEADDVRYRITSVGIPFSQAKVPSDERVSMPTAHEMVWALLSPERSVLEAVRLKDAAVYSNTSDGGIRATLAHFTFLAQFGYLEEVKDSKMREEASENEV